MEVSVQYLPSDGASTQPPWKYTKLQNILPKPGLSQFLFPGAGPVDSSPIPSQDVAVCGHASVLVTSMICIRLSQHLCSAVLQLVAITKPIGP
jgi:hypothetical protein